MIRFLTFVIVTSSRLSAQGNDRSPVIEISACDALRNAEALAGRKVKVNGLFDTSRHVLFGLWATGECDLSLGDDRARWVGVLPILSSPQDLASLLFPVEFRSPYPELNFLRDMKLMGMKSTAGLTKSGFLVNIEVDAEGVLQVPKYKLCCGSKPTWLGMWDMDQYKAVLVVSNVKAKLSYEEYAPKARGARDEHLEHLEHLEQLEKPPGEKLTVAGDTAQQSKMCHGCRQHSRRRIVRRERPGNQSKRWPRTLQRQ